MFLSTANYYKQPTLLSQIGPQFWYQNIPSSSFCMVNKRTSIMRLTLSMFDRLPISPILLLSHVTRTISDCRRIQGELQGVSQFVSSLQIVFNRTGNNSSTVTSLPMFVLEWNPASYILYNNNNNNNNNIYLLQLGCHPVAVVILHVYKIWNWLLINLSREVYMRSM